YGTVLQGIDNCLLNLFRCPPGGVNGPAIWNGNVALAVHGLRRQRDEIAGPHSSFARDEKAAGGGLEYRNGYDIPTADPRLARSAPVLECRGQSRHVLGKHVPELGGRSLQ